jgi:hypothetical protein
MMQNMVSLSKFKIRRGTREENNGIRKGPMKGELRPEITHNLHFLPKPAIFVVSLWRRCNGQKHRLK